MGRSEWDDGVLLDGGGGTGVDRSLEGPLECSCELP